MSREAYQVPTSQSSAPGGGAGSQFRAGAGQVEETGVTMHYMCGDCGTKFPLKRGDTIRCVECGCRVLYKERTKR